MDNDRNLLLGVLAVQLKGLTSDQLLEAASSWVEDPHISVADRLVESGLLLPADRAMLERLVDETIQAHGGDTAATLQTLGIQGGDCGYDSEQAARLDSLQTAPISGGEFFEEESELFSKLAEAPGRYSLIAQHARGGMGRVLMVHDEYLDRNIALKELMSSGASGSRGPSKASSVRHTAAVASRFLQEARITGQLDHPSIVPVYEVGRREDGTLYYTMKLVRGKTLGQALRDAGTLEKRLELLPNFVDLCQAIAYAHDRGVIHRDIKPANVMVGSFGETVVLDWGLAKLKIGEDLHRNEIEEALHELEIGYEEASPHTAYGRALGTPHYMSPEQAAGKLDSIDERSDVYSLGAVLYELLTGTTPYTGRNAHEVVNNVLHTHPVPVCVQNPDTPPEIAGICEKAMHRNPADRYQSAVELAADIRRFVAGSLVQAYTYSSREIIMRYYRRHRGLVNALVISFLLLTGFGVYSYLRVMDARNREHAQRVVAETAQKSEQQARVQAEREAYITQLGLLQQYLQNQDLFMANRTAVETLPGQRGWEWGYLVNRANPELLSIPTPRPVSFATIRSDGQLVATAGGEEAIHIWDLETQQIKATCEASEMLGVPCLFSPDGNRLLGACADGKIRLWDVISGKLQQTFTGGTNLQALAVFSPDGTQVLSCDGDGAIRLWDVVTGNPVGMIENSQERFLSPDFAADGSCFAAALLEQGIVKVWNRNNLSERFQCAGSDLAVFSPDGRLLATTTLTNGVILWDVASGQKIHELFLSGGIRNLHFNAHSDQVLAASMNGNARLWNTQTGELIREFPHGKSLEDARLFPDDKFVITCSITNDFVVWETATGAVVNRFTGQGNDCLGLSFSSDLRRMVVANRAQALRVFDPLYQTGRTLLHYRAGPVIANSLSVNESSGKIAAADEAGIQVFSLEGNGDRPFYSNNLVSGFSSSPVFSADGMHLAMVADPLVPCVWDLKKNEVVQFFGHTETVNAMILDPSGHRALTISSDRTVRIWDVSSGKALHILTFPERRPLCAVFSPDGSRAIVAFFDGEMIMWEVESGRALMTLKGHMAGINKILYGSDGQKLYSASKDKTVRSWDAVTGKELEVVRGHGDWVSDLSVMEKQGLLLTNCVDRKGRIWDVHGQELRVVLPDVAQLYALKNAPDVIVLTRDGRTERWATVPWADTSSPVTTSDGLQGLVANVRASHYARVQSTLTFSPFPTQIILMASEVQVVSAFQKIVDTITAEILEKPSHFVLDDVRCRPLLLLGFAKGDIVTTIGKQSPVSPEEALMAMEGVLEQVRANPASTIEFVINRNGTVIPVRLFVRSCQGLSREVSLSQENLLKVLETYLVGLTEGKVNSPNRVVENNVMKELGMGLLVQLGRLNRDLIPMLGELPDSVRLLAVEDQPASKYGDIIAYFQGLKSALAQGQLHSFTLQVQCGSFVRKTITYKMQE